MSSGLSIEQTAFLQSAHGMAVIDPDLCVHAANYAAEAFFRSTPDDQGPGRADRTGARRLPDTDFLGTMLLEDARLPPLVRLVARSGFRLLHIPEHAPGQSHLFELSRLSDDPEHPLILIEILPNLYTVRKNAEADITGRYGSELKAIRDQYAVQIEDANKRLTQFAYASAHDLQEPVRVISLLTDYIVELGETLERSEFELCLEKLGQHARQARDIVIDLMRLSQLQDRAEDWQMVDLDRLLWDTVSAYSDSLQSLRTDIEIGALGEVECDVRMMGILFSNLVSNAIKFRLGNRVALAVTGERRDGRVDIRFQDQGIGINPGFADRIFNPFERLNDRDTFEGSGLGLTICSMIAERHGGSIWACHDTEPGACIHLSLPIRQPTAMSLSAAR